jgi:hypothetical protein
MKHAILISLLGIIVALTVASGARADTLDGVIMSYESGNKGTDMSVRTSDGHRHALWFDNMKKPLFQGKPLPWCPSFPCDGWPSQLVLGKTHVKVTVVKETVEGTVVWTPTRITLVH